MAGGRCLCGQLGFETRGEARWVSYCHCASCRRHAASPVTCFVNFMRDEVVFRGDRATFASSPGVTRSHCGRCGTPISYETVKRPREIDLYLGAFDAPEAFEPQGHAFFEEHLPWFDTKDELPRR